MMVVMLLFNPLTMEVARRLPRWRQVSKLGLQIGVDMIGGMRQSVMS